MLETTSLWSARIPVCRVLWRDKLNRLSKDPKLALTSVSSKTIKTYGASRPLPRCWLQVGTFSRHRPLLHGKLNSSHTSRLRYTLTQISKSKDSSSRSSFSTLESSRRMCTTLWFSRLPDSYASVSDMTLIRSFCSCKRCSTCRTATRRWSRTCVTGRAPSWVRTLSGWTRALRRLDPIS